MVQMLRFCAVAGENGGPCVPDYGAHVAGQRRFVGRKLDTTRGVAFEDSEIVPGPNGKAQTVKTVRRHAVFIPHPDELVKEHPLNGPYAAEYLRHLRDGDLIPADQFTANEAAKLGPSPFNGKTCSFDPKFSGSLHKAFVEEPDDTEAVIAESAKVLDAVKAAVGAVAPKPTPSVSSPPASPGIGVK
jgi:hypothetical protein